MQWEMVEAIRKALAKKSHATVVAATGAGKTETVRKIKSKLKGNAKLLFIAPRINNVTDAAQRYDAAINIGSLGLNESGQVTCTTKQSIHKIDTSGYDVAVFDECFTPETEILTENGFISFKRLKNENVAQYNLDSESIEFVKPERIVKKEYCGEIINFYSDKKIDVSMTLNHEFLTTDTMGRKVKVLAKNLSLNHKRQIINTAKINDRGKKITPLDKFQVAFQADGSYHYNSKRSNSYLFSFSKERKIKRFLKIVKECGFKVSEVCKESSKKRVQRKYIVSDDRKIKFSKNMRDYFSLSEFDRNMAKELIEEMVNWDGSVLKENSYYYSSVLEDNVSFYQEIAFLCGYKTNKTVQVDNRSKNYKDIHRLFIRKKFSNTTLSGVSKKILRYSGYVYCATVKSGNIVVRSNGKILITGNCHNYKEEFINSVDAKFKIFLSATPWNDSGYIWEQFDCVSEPDFTFSLQDGIDNGVLCRYEIFGAEHSFEVKEYLKGKGDYTKSQIATMLKQGKAENQVKEIIATKEKYNRKKVAVLCANIEHAEEIKKHFEDQGERCMIVHSKLKGSHKLIEEFRDNDIPYMISVAMMQEGTDIPAIDCIAYLRPIKSSRVMVQSVGRGLRLHKDKDYCLLLDFGRIFENCGLPTNPIIPGAKKKTNNELSPIKQCEECYFIFEREFGNTCPKCGHVHKQERDVEKNLDKSVLDKPRPMQIKITRDHIHKFGKTKNGNPYMTIRNPYLKNTFHTLFGFQYKAVLSELKHTGMVKIMHTKEGKYNFKFISVESC